MKKMQMTWLDASKDTSDSSERDMFYNALPKQQKMLIESRWLAIENILLAATAEGLVCALRIPIGDEAEHVSKQVNAPKDLIMACFLAIGYAAKDAAMPK